MIFDKRNNRDTTNEFVTFLHLISIEEYFTLLRLQKTFSRSHNMAESQIRTFAHAC